MLSHSKWQFACLSTPLRPIPSRRLLSYLMEASARKSISHGSVHFSLVFVFFHLPQSDVNVSMSLTVKYTGEWIAIFMKLPDQNQLFVKDKRVVVRIGYLKKSEPFQIHSKQQRRPSFLKRVDSERAPSQGLVSGVRSARHKWCSPTDRRGGGHGR